MIVSIPFWTWKWNKPKLLKKLAHPRCKNLTSNVKQRSQKSSQKKNKHKKRCEAKKKFLGSYTVACQRKRISGRRFSYFRVEKRDDQKYICIRKLHTPR